MNTIATVSTTTILAVGLGKYKSRSRRVRSVVAAALDDYGKNASLEEAAATTERTLLLLLLLLLVVLRYRLVGTERFLRRHVRHSPGKRIVGKAVPARERVGG